MDEKEAEARPAMGTIFLVIAIARFRRLSQFLLIFFLVKKLKI